MHRDVQVIHDSLSSIDGIIVPANILAYQIPSTSAFLSSLGNTEYRIDPMIQVFQNQKQDLTRDNGDLRPSIKALVQAIHPSLAARIENLSSTASLTPRDFDLDELCSCCADFQENSVKTGTEASAAAKYLRRYASSGTAACSALMAPSFRFETVEDTWYQLSLRCAQKTQQDNVDQSVEPIIICPVSALTANGIRTLVADYSQFSAVHIWIDDFPQTQAAVDEILALRRLVRELTQRGATSRALYGGYLMALMKHEGLSGISHGILYTEHKNYRATPGSGAPPERYYIPKFHEFRSLSQTDLILHKHPELICGCSVCRSVIGGDPDNIIHFHGRRELLQRHFIFARQAELDALDGATNSGSATELRNTAANYHKTVARLPNPDSIKLNARMRGLDHLNVWASALIAPL
jgi:hypothetical protein